MNEPTKSQKIEQEIDDLRKEPDHFQQSKIASNHFINNTSPPSSDRRRSLVHGEPLPLAGYCRYIHRLVSRESFHRHRKREYSIELGK